MKTFYSAADIEQLASQGVRELAIDEDTVLTSVAREAAQQLGIELVMPGRRSVGGAATPARPAENPLKPRGCQHGRAGSGQGQASARGRGVGDGSGQSQVVDELASAVRQMAKM